MLINVKNKFALGDEVEIITPGEIYKVKITKIIAKKNNQEVAEAIVPQERFLVYFDKKIEIPERSLMRKKTK